MEPFVSEIRAVGFNFAPRGWAMCNGSLLPINQNTALFSLLGTTYGGDGRTTFGLPDLRGRLIVQPGQGPGLSRYVLGQVSGSETQTLLATQMPAHIHQAPGLAVAATSATSGGVASPAGNVPGASNAVQRYSTTPDVQMAAGSVNGTATAVGSNTAHSNLMPYLSLNYIIALEGIFPQRP